MANVTLKSFQLPGLDNTYVVPQVDNTLTQPGRPADAKKTGDEIAAINTALSSKASASDLTAETTAREAADEALTEAIANKASADGSYEGMTVGSSEQLLSDSYTEDKVPYLFRASGGNGADREYDEIVGGTVAWNQLVGATATSVTVQSGHKAYKSISGTASVFASDGTAIAVTGGTDIVIDLTALFGTTIADYIYSLETATAGAGVAFFRKLFPKDYYPYDAGTLKSVEDVSAHEMVGFNQWDEVWESGYYDANGNSAASAGQIRSKNFIQVIPGTEYYAKMNAHRFCYYAADKTFISRSDLYGANNHLFTVPDNCAYIKFHSDQTGGTYQNDICINISDPSRNGTYEPYVKHSYPLDDSLTLRGIPKLDASNNLYYDGDVYASDGTVTRRYGVVDLGTLTWTLTDSTNSIFKAENLSGHKVTSDINIVCAKYVAVPAYYPGASMADKNIKTNSSQATWIYVKDTAYTDAATFKTAMSGVMLVYELATPTTETADPYEALQIVDPYGTEEYVSTGIVPVGHNTKYPENLKAKIEGLPWNFATLIAPTEATYTATRNYTTGALFIVSNILYKATANIANGGTITPGTNCQATTLAEVISALA